MQNSRQSKSLLRIQPRIPPQLLPSYRGSRERYPRRNIPWHIGAHGSEEGFRRTHESATSPRYSQTSPEAQGIDTRPCYLAAPAKPNVGFVTYPITNISEATIHTQDGGTYTMDALVCTVGFHTSAPPPCPLLGLNDVNIKQKWATRAALYLSLTMDGYLSFLMLIGLGSAIRSGSLTMMIESVGDYIVRLRA